MHSATKFIAGHSDVMAGVLAVKGERYASQVSQKLSIVLASFEMNSRLVVDTSCDTDLI